MTPVVATETNKEPSVEAPQKNADSEVLAASSEVTAGEQTPSEPSASAPAPSEPSETKEEAAS